MNTFAKSTKKFACVLAVAAMSATSITAALMGSASAQEINNWQNPYGDVWMNGTNELCWRNAFWTPATGIAGCDGVPPPPEPEPVQPVVPQTPVVPVAPPTPPVVEPPVAEPPVVQPPPVVLSRVVLHADTFFDFDKSSLKPEGRQVLDQVAEQVNTLREVEGVIAIGHTDSTGSDVYNQRLSERRAEAVKTYLVSKGVDANHIQTEGKGKTMPAASNATRAGRAQNRRVEIEIIGTRVSGGNRSGGN